MSYLCPSCNSFPTEDNVWWVSAGKKHCSWWCGASASQAEVFKAHAVPQGVCGNLVSALKLLANQLKDGDSPIQSIVAGLCERSKNSIMEGLRHFIEEQKTVPQKRAEVYAALQHAASLVEDWKDCDELKPKPKGKADCCGPEKRGNETPNGVVCLRPTSIDV